MTVTAESLTHCEDEREKLYQSFVPTVNGLESTEEKDHNRAGNKNPTFATLPHLTANALDEKECAANVDIGGRPAT